MGESGPADAGGIGRADHDPRGDIVAYLDRGEGVDVAVRPELQRIGRAAVEIAGLDEPTIVCVGRLHANAGEESPIANGRRILCVSDVDVFLVVDIAARIELRPARYGHARVDQIAYGVEVDLRTVGVQIVVVAHRRPRETRQ